MPGIARARSSQPRGFSSLQVVRSEGDKSRSRSRIQGGYPSCGDEGDRRGPKALERSRSGFKDGNPGGNSQGREFFYQATGQTSGLRIDRNNTLGPRRRSLSVDQSYQGITDTQETRRLMCPSP